MAMPTLRSVSPFLALFAASCSGLIDVSAHEPTIVWQQPLGRTVPASPPTPFAAPVGLVDFTYQLPDTPFTGGSTQSDAGGFHVDTAIRANGISLEMDPNTSANFDGIATATLYVNHGGNVAVARYQRDPANPPGKTLTLTAVPGPDGQPVELLGLVGANNTLSISLTATGTGPQADWTANVAFDLQLHADVSGP